MMQIIADAVWFFRQESQLTCKYCVPQQGPYKSWTRDMSSGYDVVSLLELYNKYTNSQIESEICNSTPKKLHGKASNLNLSRTNGGTLRGDSLVSWKNFYRGATWSASFTLQEHHTRLVILLQQRFRWATCVTSDVLFDVPTQHVLDLLLQERSLVDQLTVRVHRSRCSYTKQSNKNIFTHNNTV